MKTVGIITLHTPINYGSCLQTFATSEFVRRHGFEPTIIDYRYPTNYHKKLAQNYNASSTPWTFFRKLKNKIASFFTEKPLYGIVKYKIDNFYNNRINLSEAYYSAMDLKLNPPRYDIYLTGSDQVWNPKFMGEDTTFLLSWVPKGAKKISYASSMSVKEMPSSLEKLYKNYLCEFNHLSTREDSSIVTRMTGKLCTQCLDPTFLLNKYEWSQFASKAPLVQGKYILCYLLGYMFNPFPYVYNIISKVKKETGYKIVMIGGHPEELWHGIKSKPNCGPEDFLNLFLHASFVITSSFHGSAFALNFGIPFFSIINDKATLDNRQVSLASSVGIQDQVVIKMNTNVNSIKLPNYNLHDVCDKIEALRDMSKAYFENALKD